MGLPGTPDVTTLDATRAPTLIPAAVVDGVRRLTAHPINPTSVSVFEQLAVQSFTTEELAKRHGLIRNNCKRKFIESKYTMKQCWEDFESVQVDMSRKRRREIFKPEIKGERGEMRLKPHQTRAPGWHLERHFEP
jgi:hypothetical protein